MTSTITLPRSVVEQALEALKIGHESAHDCAETFHIEMAGYKQQRHEALDAEVKQISDAIGALRAALEQPKPLPSTVWRFVPTTMTDAMAAVDKELRHAVPWVRWEAILAAAPQPPRQPLTEMEIVELRQLTPGTLDVQFVKFARAIERAHGIKGDA